MILDWKKILINVTFEASWSFKQQHTHTFYIQKFSGKSTRHVKRDYNIENKRIAVQKIKKYFENHQSMKQIKENFQHKYIPSLPYTTTEEVKSCCYVWLCNNCPTM